MTRGQMDPIELMTLRIDIMRELAVAYVRDGNGIPDEQEIKTIGEAADGMIDENLRRSENFPGRTPLKRN